MASQGNGIIQLLQSILNKSGEQPMSEKIPGVGGTPSNIPVNPTSPDIKTVLGSIVSQSSVMPGADKPMPQKQYPNYGQPSAYREYSTSGGHSRAAMADIFGNVKEIIQTSEKNKDAKEARNLAIDIERLTLAMQNPEDPNNKLIIDDITHDQKRMKKIKEALNVNFMSDERDPVAKQAHSIAMKSIQEKMGQQQGQGQQQDPASALKRQLGMPTVASVAPEVAAFNSLKPETQKVLLPTADQLLKSNTDLNVAMNNDASKERIAAIVASTKDADLREKIFERLSKDNVEKIKATLRFKQVQYAADKMLERTKLVENRLTTIQVKGDKQTEEMINQAKTLIPAIKQAADELKKTPESSWGFKNKDYPAVKERFDKLKKQFDDLQTLINNRRITGALTNGNNDTGTFGTNDAEQLINSISSYEDITGTDQ